MSLEQAAQVAETVSSVAILLSLVFVAYQLRQSGIVSRAQARHAISEFALQLSQFRAQNADRLAKIHRTEDLTDGDPLFRFWDHTQTLLHAETYFRHYELGLMPDSHWNGYTRFVISNISLPGFRECWREIGPGFSSNFAARLDRLIAAQSTSQANRTGSAGAGMLASPAHPT
jgi:hypothetical protein